MLSLVYSFNYITALKKFKITDLFFKVMKSRYLRRGLLLVMNFTAHLKIVTDLEASCSSFGRLNTIGR